MSVPWTEQAQLSVLQKEHALLGSSSVPGSARTLSIHAGSRPARPTLYLQIHDESPVDDDGKELTGLLYSNHSTRMEC